MLAGGYYFVAGGVICLCSLVGGWFWCRFSLDSIELRLWWYLVVVICWCLWCCGYFDDVVRLDLSVNSVVVVQFLFFVLNLNCFV